MRIAVRLAVALAVSLASAAAAADSVVDSTGGSGTAVERVRKAREGVNVSDQAARLRDPDPQVRLNALKGLAEEGGAGGKDVAIQAVDDPDPRVQAKALDVLVQLRAKDAAPALLQRMFLKGASAPLRKRILVTLRALGDADTARALLDYARNERDAELRGAAVVAVGQLADPSLAEPLRGFAQSETDPNIQRVANEAVIRLSTPKP